MPPTTGKNSGQAASSTMTKNEYQTDIHELIQKTPTNPKKRVSEEINLAFDKCTLLSSQRSDAPRTRPHDHHQGQLHHLTHTPQPPAAPATTRTRRNVSVRNLRGAGPTGPSALPFGANNKNTTPNHPPRRIHPTPRACRILDVAGPRRAASRRPPRYRGRHDR